MEAVRKILDVEKLKYCFECGICTASCSMAELLGEDYNPRVLLEKIVQNPEEVLASEAIWLCAWCYSCYRRCPQGLRVPEILLEFRKVAGEQGGEQSMERAFQKITDNIPLPLVTTLVCFHPERAGLDAGKILETIESRRKLQLKKAGKRKTTKDSDGKIAIVGSGPAGLTVAFEMVRRGYDARVFEILPEAGGMLRKCIPESRLPARILDKEIGFLKDYGVDVQTGVTVGKDLSFDDLWKEGYKAVFVGTGAHKSQKPRIEGLELEGAIHALDFLWETKCGEKAKAGKTVVVIGGGNVAVDAARTAAERGAKNVTVLYRRSREEMPANPWEVKEAEDNGVKIEFLVSPKKVLGENGKVCGIECLRVQLGEPDETGRRRPIPIEGSEFVLQTDMVIFAVGETPELGFLPKQIAMNDDGTIWVNPVTMQTSMLKVFAGGDVVSGPASVIEAICAGKRAATAIESYLKSSGE